MNISSLTTKDIIRLLPLKAELKSRLLDAYPEKVTYEQGVRIEETAWDVFYEYYDVVYQSLLRKEIMENSGPLPEGFQDRLLEKTEEHLLKEFELVGTSSKLDELRKQLQDLTQ